MSIPRIDPEGASEAAALLAVQIVRCCDALRTGEAPPPIEEPIGTDEDCTALVADSLGAIGDHLGLTERPQRLALVNLMAAIAVLVTTHGPALTAHLHEALYPPAGTA